MRFWTIALTALTVLAFTPDASRACAAVGHAIHFAR